MQKNIEDKNNNELVNNDWIGIDANNNIKDYTKIILFTHDLLCFAYAVHKDINCMYNHGNKYMYMYKRSNFQNGDGYQIGGEKEKIEILDLNLKNKKNQILDAYKKDLEDAKDAFNDINEMLMDDKKNDNKMSVDEEDKENSSEKKNDKSNMDVEEDDSEKRKRKFRDLNIYKNSKRQKNEEGRKSRQVNEVEDNEEDDDLYVEVEKEEDEEDEEEKEEENVEKEIESLRLFLSDLQDIIKNKINIIKERRIVNIRQTGGKCTARNKYNINSNDIDVKILDDYVKPNNKKNCEVVLNRIIKENIENIKKKNRK